MTAVARDLTAHRTARLHAAERRTGAAGPHEVHVLFPVVFGLHLLEAFHYADCTHPQRRATERNDHGVRSPKPPTAVVPRDHEPDESDAQEPVYPPAARPIMLASYAA